MYAILRTKKLNNRKKITNAIEHNLRLRTQPNIDGNRSHLNEILYNPLEADFKDACDFQNKLTAYYLKLGVKEKKDNILAFEYVVTASPEFFANKQYREIKKWAMEQFSFMKKEFGEQVKFSVLHLDEKTPHLHFFVSTEVKSIKKYKNRYGVFEKETWSLNSQKIDPDYLTGLQTRFASANSHWGLKRGVKNSRQKHVPLKQFYKVVDRIVAINYKRRIDDLINSLELKFGERLKIDTVRDKIRSHLSPCLINFARQGKIYNEFSKLDFHQLQEKLIEDQEKLKKQVAAVEEKRLVYKEAINQFSDLKLENDSLQNEIEELKKKYALGNEYLPPGTIKNNLHFPIIKRKFN